MCNFSKAEKINVIQCQSQLVSVWEIKVCRDISKSIRSWSNKFRKCLQINEIFINKKLALGRKVPNFSFCSYLKNKYIIILECGFQQLILLENRCHDALDIFSLTSVEIDKTPISHRKLITLYIMYIWHTESSMDRSRSTLSKYHPSSPGGGGGEQYCACDAKWLGDSSCNGAGGGGDLLAVLSSASSDVML